MFRINFFWLNVNIRANCVRFRWRRLHYNMRFHNCCMVVFLRYSNVRLDNGSMLMRNHIDINVFMLYGCSRWINNDRRVNCRFLRISSRMHCDSIWNHFHMLLMSLINSPVRGVNLNMSSVLNWRMDIDIRVDINVIYTMF